MRANLQADPERLERKRQNLAEYEEQLSLHEKLKNMKDHNITNKDIG